MSDDLYPYQSDRESEVDKASRRNWRQSGQICAPFVGSVVITYCDSFLEILVFIDTGKSALAICDFFFIAGLSADSRFGGNKLSTLQCC